MTRYLNGLNKIRSLSLKWKLVIPFLFFAFAGTTTLAFISLTSQQNLIVKEEKRSILLDYRHFLETLSEKEVETLSLASIIAENPQVQALFAERDRQGLIKLLDNTYQRLKKDFDIDQIHFHLSPTVSFLRLHAPEKRGVVAGPPRRMVEDAFKEGRPVSGIERGVTGLGIRGIVPVRKGVKIVGAIEIGHSLSGKFLRKHSQRWGIQIALYEKKTNGAYSRLGGSNTGGLGFIPEHDIAQVEAGGISIVIAPKEYPGQSFLLGPIKDYSGKVAALVEIVIDRREIVNRLSNTRFMMIVVALGAIAISFLLTYLVAVFFIRPIKGIVQEAQDIAEEKRETRLELRSQDEIGTLTKALNTMLDALHQRRKEIEEYADSLEKRVKERTNELVNSEEKYRTLVENIPLIVYRILRDGTTEFINSAITESLGYGIEEAVGDRTFWREKICGEETDPGKDIFKVCFQEGRECRTQRRVKDKTGRRLIFIDHAIPAWSLSGSVKWVDGIMMDITELKRLQERDLRSEEIRLLGEISARMAHEIRNPLSTAGGFARRLQLSLSDEDPNKKSAQIILEEVAKLENVLKILLSSIKPFDLSLTEVDVGQILAALLKTFKGLLKSKKIEAVREIPPGLPMIQGDAGRLTQALENLLKHAIVSTPEGEKFYLAVRRISDHLEITLRHKVAKLSEDDLEKFFFPHVEDWTDTTILDLPLSKIIIHRHKGKVDLTQESGNILVMKIELPIVLTEEGPV